MKAAILPNKNLKITVDPSEQSELREMGEEIHSDRAMIDFLEPLTCNSEYSWVSPEDCLKYFGDLHDAPALGIRAYDGETVTDRWAFMDYQVRSVLEDLRDKGKVIFIQ